MNGKRFSEGKARKNGFYLALAVCLTAVGIAAWSTYDAVQNYAKTGMTQESSAVLQEEQNKDVRETPNPEDPEAPAAATKPTTTPKPTKTPKPTATPKPSAAPTQEPEESEPTQSKAEQVPVNAPVYERSSQLVRPIQSGEVSKAFSSGAPVYSETMKDWRVHAGTDYQAENGADVWACANGKVLQTYTDSMMGNVILIEHGDYLISYCGVSESFQVQPGDVVTKGQVIGTVTAVPFESAEATHLHLEVRRDGGYLDPESLFGD